MPEVKWTIFCIHNITLGIAISIRDDCPSMGDDVAVPVGLGKMKN